MNWDGIESLIETAKSNVDVSHLGRRQIESSGHHDPYYNFLRSIAYCEKPSGVFLEIGCFNGCVAAHVCEDFGSHGHKFMGVDINPVPFEHPEFTVLLGDSTDPSIFKQVKIFSEAHGGIFAIFHDSSHHYYPSVKEFNLYRPLLRPGGLWISDDITPSFKTPDDPKSMAEWWDELSGDKREYDNLHIGSRIGIIRT